MLSRSSSIIIVITGSLLLSTEMLHGQEITPEKTDSKLEMSVDIFSGETSIVTGLNLSKSSASTVEYHYTPTFGFGGDLGYTLAPRFSAHVNIGYLQRGAVFTMSTTTEKRSFQLSYVDLWFYSEYNTHEKVKFTFLVGPTLSTLLVARLTAQGGSASVMHDFKRTDFGLVAGPGVLLPVHKNKIRIRTLFSYGFRDVFAENHFDDNIKAHNHAYLLQLGYIW